MTVCLPCFSTADPGYQAVQITLPGQAAQLMTQYSGSDAWQLTTNSLGTEFAIFTECGLQGGSCQGVLVVETRSSGGCGYLTPVSYNSSTFTYTYNSDPGLTRDWPGGQVFLKLGTGAANCPHCPFPPSVLTLTAAGFAGNPACLGANGTFTLTQIDPVNSPCAWHSSLDANGFRWALIYYNFASNPYSYWVQWFNQASGITYWAGHLDSFQCHGANDIPGAATQPPGSACTTYASSVHVVGS